MRWKKYTLKNTSKWCKNFQQIHIKKKFPNITKYFKHFLIPRIEGFDYTKTVKTTTFLNTETNKQTTLAEYMKSKYQVQIKNDTLPLLKVLRKDSTYIVPELCRYISPLYNHRYLLVSLNVKKEKPKRTLKKEQL